MSPNLLFVSHSAEWTGPTNSLLHILRYVDKRFDVGVLVPGEGDFSEALKAQGIAALPLPSLTKRQIPDIYHLITAGRYDMVYGNNTSGACRNALLAAKLAGVPFICHVRGMAKKRQWKKFGFLRFADAIIAVSAASARSVSPYVRSERLHVVHNGVDVPDSGTTKTTSGSRAAWDIPAESKLLVSVAHVNRRKGQHFAIRALKEVVGHVPSAHLAIVGALNRDPGYLDEVRTEIGGQGLDAHVSILGFRSDVQRLLQVSDVFLHTAIEDPHPRAVIEAMASGLPVIAFGVDGLSETVVPGETGYLIPAGDTNRLASAAIELLIDGPLRARMGSAGRQRARDSFSAEATARRIGTLIESVLENRPLNARQTRSRQAVVR